MKKKLLLFIGLSVLVISMIVCTTVSLTLKKDVLEDANVKATYQAQSVATIIKADLEEKISSAKSF